MTMTSSSIPSSHENSDSAIIPSLSTSMLFTTMIWS
eukprot:CAMPEP_0182500908 /NCGR_PEP_ID=MMETSP1321-20130603/10308_1 /TAXON_ID=91990 /ORGANISM="Bolidomonas sp., Strain RCC1657" /LENGTH=35 /DNA_ID= /DNA_START= /DNA_END= /DNA_ORIENTATION=